MHTRHNITGGERVETAAVPAISAHQQQTRDLVQAMMALTGLSASGLAKAAGLTPTTVNRFLRHPVRHTLSQRTMLALMTETFARLARLPAAAIDRDTLRSLAPAAGVFQRAILERVPAARSIIDMALAGDGGSLPFSYSDNEPRGLADDIPVVTGPIPGLDIAVGDFRGALLRTARPPFLSSDPRAFAVLMPDEAMTPRFDPGDIVYASPARPLDGANVDVIVEYADGRVSVRRLVAQTPAQVTVATLSPPQAATVQRKDIRGLYRVIAAHRAAQ
ncbi:MAG: hypothetical protein KDE14_10690 [Rhodobacteraceae bacterium]|nr:hypothetical protein [Paracoccaceae bacterium]